MTSSSEIEEEATKENIQARNQEFKEDEATSEKIQATKQRKFRSVLPHEPLPVEQHGYLHIQGSFEPRTPTKKNENESKEVKPVASFWTKSTLEQALLQSFASTSSSASLINRHPIQSVQVLDTHAPFTKVRFVLESPHAARESLSTWRRSKVTPADLLHRTIDESETQDHFSTRPVQVTQVTTCPMISPELSWSRSNAPKFRRLLARPGEDLASLEEERARTRFVFITGLVDGDVPSCWDDPFTAADAIRKVISVYDTSGLGAEVFVSNKNALRFCHVGMRSPADAKTLISSLQGQQLEWRWQEHGDESKEICIRSGKLYLDYADITKRSVTRGQNSDADITGEPARSECTSLTASVVVPGLVLIPNFVSEEEEEALVAILTGPQAPWARPQSNPSLSGTVKRRVQHYGYVFDYETADVLRDRSKEGADCPPLPALPCDFLNLEGYIEKSVSQGRGWEALAGVIERTRKHDFAPDLSESDVAVDTVCFPELNQMTVNEYKEGSGIGSHVDTPSAFGDGLISISLNAGIAMEFRLTHQEAKNDEGDNAPSTLRKLVYLPRRSLLLMSGPARYLWEHMIVTRMTDTHEGQVISRGRRVSLTLRTALDVASKSSKPLLRVESSKFPPKWAWDDNGGSSIEDEKTGEFRHSWSTPSTEKDHVHAVYDAIATQWHHTRGKRGVLWPGATQFLTRLPRGSVVADVGCGDGKYFPAIWEAGSVVIGTDISLPLLKTSIGANSGSDLPENSRVSDTRSHWRDRPAVAVADCMSIPLRSNSCDAAICIAVMHHLSTEARRCRCIEELARIVRPGGSINIQAWAMEQDEDSRRKFAAADVFVPFNAQPKYLDKKQASKDAEDPAGSGMSVAQMYSEAYDGAEFDERKGLVVFKRYCHLYRQGELEELVSRVNGVDVSESGYESGNHFVILKVISGSASAAVHNEVN
jgi:alkylated DNA repair protein alkB family protein 8